MTGLQEVLTASDYKNIAKNKAIDYIKQKLLKDNHNIKEIKDVKILT